MLKTLAKKHARYQKGNALVEFALILPIFMTLALGMIYYSFALYNKTILMWAAREGAREGAISSDTGSAQSVALSVCNDKLIAIGGHPTPTVNPPAISSAHIIKVEASCNYPGFYVFPGFPISAQTSMRVEP